MSKFARVSNQSLASNRDDGFAFEELEGLVLAMMTPGLTAWGKSSSEHNNKQTWIGDPSGLDRGAFGLA